MEKTLQVITTLLARIGELAVLAMMVMVTADVALRQISGGRGIAGIVETTAMLVAVAVFASLPHAQRANDHITLGIASEVLPRVTLRRVRLVALVILLAISAWFSFAVGDRAIESIRTGEAQIGLVTYPLWPARLVIAVGFVVLTLQVVRQLLTRDRQGESNTPE